MLKKLCAAVIFALAAVTLAVPSPVRAQPSGGVVMIPPITPGDCTKWYATNIIEDAGATCAGSGGGVSWPSSGDVVVSNGTSSPDGVAPSGTDCLVSSSGSWTAGSCGSGVPSIAGTTNQINESGSPGATTLSLSSTLVAPGTVTVPNSDFKILGSSTGVNIFASANAGASNYTDTFPAYTGNVLVTNTSSPAQGDITYFDGTHWTDLAPSVSGYVLATQGSSANPHWVSPSSGGTVTEVDTGACLTGGPITTTGTISGTYAINARTGGTYAIQTTDACNLVTLTHSGTVAVSLSAATTTGFTAGFSFDIINYSTGDATITPATSTIGGAATLVLHPNESCEIVSDGTNYQVSLCGAFAKYGQLAIANTWTAAQSFNSTDLILNGSSSGTTTLNAAATAGTTTATLPDNTGIIAELNYAQTWSAAQTFNNADLLLAGSSSGALTLEAPAAASTYVATLPANTGTIGELNLAQVWSAQQSNCVTALTVSTTTFTPDGTCNNYSFTLVTACSTACTVANPSATPVAGTAGVMTITQFSGGGKTITWGSEYYAAGGSSTVQPDTTGSGLNFISYYVADSTHILITAAATNATH